MYPRLVFPHPRIPTSTIEAFGANLRGLSREETLDAGRDRGVEGAEGGIETGRLVVCRDTERVLPSISDAIACIEC